MKINMLADDSATTIPAATTTSTTLVVKKSNQQQNSNNNNNNKHYKNYNNNNAGICGNNSNLQQQQQQKTRNYYKMKFSNNKNINKYHNNNNVHYLVTKKSHYDHNYNNINHSPTMNNKNFNLLKTNSFNRLKLNHQQQQHYHNNNNNNNNNNLLKNQNLLSTSISSSSSSSSSMSSLSTLSLPSSVASSTKIKSSESPVISAIYTTTWRTRNSNNTNIKTRTPSPNINNNNNNNNTNNDDNNNNNTNKSCCHISPLKTPTTKLSIATSATSKNRRNSLTNLQESQQQQLQQQQKPKSNTTNAKISSNADGTPKNQRAISSAVPTTTTTATTQQQNEPQLQQEHFQISTKSHQQQQQQQQSLRSDCSYSFDNFPRTHSTTARTKSSPNTTSSSSSSSLPLPFSSSVNSTNNTNNNNNNSSSNGNSEYVTKGGGGGGSGSGGGSKSHSGRKKYWKVSGVSSGGAVTVTAAVSGGAGIGGARGGGSASIPLPANGIPKCTDATIESNIINSASPKTSSQYKNSTNRGHRYHPLTQPQYPEAWKKTSTTMSAPANSDSAPALSIEATKTTETATAAAAAATATVTTITTTTKSTSNNSIASTTSTSSPTVTTTTPTNVNAPVVIAAERPKHDGVKKTTSDASTTTEKYNPDEKVVSMPPAQHYQHPQPLLSIPPPTIKPRSSYSDNNGNANRNFPGSMPSYSLDFLHAVGKRMSTINGTGTCNKMGVSTVPATVTTNPPPPTGHRSNRYISHNNSGYGNNNQHHHHHHPQPQQLTIASFLQKDMFTASPAGMRVVGGGGSGGGGNSGNNNNNNNNNNNGSNMNCDNSPHAYNNQTPHQQHRFHNYYNHPPSNPHYYRQQSLYQGYGGNNGLVSTPAGGGNSRYHNNSHNSNGGGASSDHVQQRQQHSRNQQQRQHHLPLQQQQQQQQQQLYNGQSSSNNNNNNNNNTNNNNFGINSPPNLKNKMIPVVKGLNQNTTQNPSNLQHATSPSSSTSSLSSLASTASSHMGNNSRQSNGSHKSNSRPNSAMEMLPPKGNAFSMGPGTSGAYRHNNHNRHHNGHQFGHHNHTGPNGMPLGVVIGQHQNFNNLTYVPTGNGSSIMGPPPSMPAINNTNIGPPQAIHNHSGISTSESSSRACSPSILSSSDNASPEPSQAIMLGMPNRYMPPDQQVYIMNTQNLVPPSMCPPMLNVSANDTATTHNGSDKLSSTGTDYEDSECSSSQHSEKSMQHCNSFQQTRGGPALPHGSQSGPPPILSPIEYAYNSLMQQMHYPPQPYRNGMMPNVAQMPPNGFHEDDYHLQNALQQQLPNMFFPANEQMNSVNGHNANGFPNTGNVMYSQSAVTLIPACPSPATASNSPRSSEEDKQLVSSRSSSSAGEQMINQSQCSTNAEICNTVAEINDQMASLARNNTVGGGNQQNARIRNGRGNPQHQHQHQHPHPHPMPPVFMHYPFNQQSVFCSNYLAYLRSTPSNTSSDLNSNTPPDRFMSRSHLVEVRETPSTLLTNSKWDKLSQQIWTKFVDSQQTEKTYKLKMHMWRCLYLTIKKTYPRYGLYLVGSTMSGFGAETSDVDMCLVSRSFAFVEQRMEALFNLTILRECLKKTADKDFEGFNLIEAKVPILRFRDKCNHFEVDLNFNNSVGIKNTHLLHCYTQLDWRLRPLSLIVKLWAQYHNINNAKNMTISSYSLVLMVIHFLQCGVSPPVLPCLHKMYPDKFPLLRSNDFGHVDMNDNVGPYESKNIQTLGELFLNFLEYYSSFDYRQNAISIRTGGLLPVNICRQVKSLKNDVHQWRELCIEEPFDLTNTARSVYDFDTFERVKAVFTISFHAMQKSFDLSSVFAALVVPRLPISARIYMKRTPLPNSMLISKADNNEQQKTTITISEKATNDCVTHQESKGTATDKDDNIEQQSNIGRADTATATSAL